MFCGYHVLMETELNAVVRWTVLVPRFDEKGMIPVVDGSGRRFLTDRAELRHAVNSGIQVSSESGYRLTLADVDAGRLL
jgi:hypothetical protein